VGLVIDKVQIGIENSDNGGKFSLEILRVDDRLNIDDPHQRAEPFEMMNGLGKTSADTTGNLSFTETSADRMER
jgi:hypothetical protein